MTLSPKSIYKLEIEVYILGIMRNNLNIRYESYNKRVDILLAICTHEFQKMLDPDPKNEEEKQIFRTYV